MAYEPSNGRKAMQEELIRGHDMANQLLEVLARNSSTHYHGVQEGLLKPLAQDLVHKVLISFTNALFLLNNNNSDVFVEEVEVPDTIIRDSTKPWEMDVACKNFDTRKRGRGCYKRKLNTPTWEMDGSVLTDDGHAWRKYGQKMTTNAKYVRSYYKCTYKYDRGCPAIKHVQRIQENPPLYRTTYFGHHTCQSSFIILDTISESDYSSGSSILLNFNNTLPIIKQEQTLSSSLLESGKQEHTEVIHDDQISHNQLCSSNDYYLLLSDYELDFNYSRHVMLSSTESVQVDDNHGTKFGF